jgi:hypothetical protein
MPADCQNVFLIKNDRDATTQRLIPSAPRTAANTLGQENEKAEIRERSEYKKLPITCATLSSTFGSTRVGIITC